MKDFQNICLQKHGSLTVEEQGWVDILRAIAPEGVPRPSLLVVQALRLAMKAEAARQTAKNAALWDVEGVRSETFH